LELSGEHRSGAQTESSKQWEGQIVDGLFPLRQYLGGDETGAVFETEFEGQRAAIKVIEAAGRGPEQIIWHWRLASKVSHPHLISLWKVGRCRLDGAAVAYLVMEYAEENLGQVLPDRPLTPAEAKEMLAPALDAIACIHREGFVHGGLTPANIMAVNDWLKLSSDNLRRAGEMDDLPALQGAFRAPEVAAGGKLSPAGDIWALGVTLVETLTQRRPAWTGTENQLVLPEGVAEPFLTIVRQCLRPQPQERWTAAEITAHLQAPPVEPKKSRTWWYAGAAVVAIAILAVWVGTYSVDPIRPSVTSSRPATAPESAPASVPTSPAPAPSQPASPPPPSSQPEPVAAASDVSSPPAAPPPTPEPVAAASSASSDVLNQPMPEVLEKARRSIQGKVNVNLKVRADAYGDVREAALEPPPVSRYFSGVALKAVRRWKFRPVKAGETFVPQDWMVRFEFTRADTKVQVEHAAP
jgi:serine/threonine protein kinase